MADVLVYETCHSTMIFHLKHFWGDVLIAAPVIVGVWTLFGKGMILGWLGDIGDRWLPLFIQKPLYGCLPCMSSVWGTALWFALGNRVEPTWPLFCLALCGILKIVADNFLHHE